MNESEKNITTEDSREYTLPNRSDDKPRKLLPSKQNDEVRNMCKEVSLTLNDV